MSGAALRYPFDTEPGTGGGSAVTVAPGVLWLRMPLFAGLPWINVWALADGGGWTIVDTGLHTPATIDAWQQAFAGALDGKPILRVVVTHLHPDHSGMAGWLTDRFEAPLWMSRLEYLTCRLMAADSGRTAPPAAIDFYRAAGWDAAAIDRYRERFGFFGEKIHALPASYRRLSDREQIRIGANDWIVVVGNGHSPEHACLHCPALKLFISGDQVLPRISSNVSVYPTEPDGDPLRDWLDSLASISDRVPDDVLVLPAHNSPFRGLHARIVELSEGHHQRLDRLAHLLAEPKRAIDAFTALFFRPITPDLLGMATGESIAHLKYLTSTGRSVREEDEHGVWWWRRPPA